MISSRFIGSEKPLWLAEIGRILKDNGFKKAPTRVVPNFLLGFLALFLKDIALFKDRLGKSQITKSDNAKNLLGWKPEYTFETLMDEMIIHWETIYDER